MLIRIWASRDTRMFEQNARSLDSVMSVRQGDETLYHADRNMTSRVLVVDNEDTIRILLCEILTNQGYSVAAAAYGRRAIGFLESRTFDLIITNSNMPGVGGL